MNESTLVDYLIEADDVRVTKQLHYVDLLQNLLQILLVQLTLLNYFYRNLYQKQELQCIMHTGLDCRLVKNIGANPNFGEENVVKTDKRTGIA